MKYRTIVADPPWKYKTSSGILTTAKTLKPEASSQYPVMTNDEIAALDIPAEQSAHLFLWVTNPLMFGVGCEGPSPVEILEAWGFRYVTLLTWLKQGTMGMGYYFRGETEHILFGVKGDAPIAPEIRERNWFQAPKKRHSQKPEVFYDIVERVSPGPYLELFARRNRLGWDTWGNESINHVTLATEGSHP